MIFFRYRRHLGLLAIVAMTGLFAGACESKGNSMSKPLVYLIPESYLGPVFVFFGQSDGVATVPDPLGNAVQVPENGVVKLQARPTDLIKPNPNGERNIYWVRVSPNGARKVMLLNNNTQVADDGGSIDSYFDERGVLQRHSKKGAIDPFYYFDENQKKERMVFEHGSCKHQKFSPPDAPQSSWPACGKFLVISPSEYLKKPAWLWDETTEEYGSISEYETEANERAKKIKALKN